MLTGSSVIKTKAKRQEKEKKKNKSHWDVCKFVVFFFYIFIVLYVRCLLHFDDDVFIVFWKLFFPCFVVVYNADSVVEAELCWVQCTHGCDVHYALFCWFVYSKHTISFHIVGAGIGIAFNLHVTIVCLRTGLNGFTKNATVDTW